MKPIGKSKQEDKNVNHIDVEMKQGENYKSKLSREEYLELIAEPQEQ